MRREVAVVLRIPQNSAQGRHERVRQPHGSARTRFAPTSKVAVRPVRLIQSPVRHRQRIVDAAGLGIESQSPFQVCGSGRMVLPRQGDATRLDPQCRRVGPPCEQRGHDGLGRLRPTQLQIHAAEPDGGRQIRRPALEGPAEALGRPLEITHPPQRVRQVIGPLELRRGQRLRVAEAPLRRRHELGCQEQHAELAVRLGARVRRRLRIACDHQQRSIGLAELAPHRRMQMAERGQRHRLQCLRPAIAELRRTRRGVGPPRRRCGDGGEAAQEQCRPDVPPRLPRRAQRPAVQWSTRSVRPVPSIRVSQRPAARSVHASIRPLGQSTSTRRTLAAPPSPTSTRGSLAEA